MCGFVDAVYVRPNEFFYWPDSKRWNFNIQHYSNFPGLSKVGLMKAPSDRRVPGDCITEKRRKSRSTSAEPRKGSRGHDGPVRPHGSQSLLGSAMFFPLEGIKPPPA